MVVRIAYGMIGVVAILLITGTDGFAQNNQGIAASRQQISQSKPAPQKTARQQTRHYDWPKIIQIDIDKTKYPGKYKVAEDILNNMAADPAGYQIFENIAGISTVHIHIKDKEDLLKANDADGAGSMFSADYGIQVIQQDMKYDPIDNELVLNFGKSGEMLGFDEQKHQFFKLSLNSTIATELEYAGIPSSASVKNCRQLLSKMNPDEHFLFDNYKDLMGEKFTNDDIEHCRNKKITIHNIRTNANEPYTFTDNVTDALKEYRKFAEDYKKNAYALYTRDMPLAQKYLDHLGEPHRSPEPVFTVRLGENRSRPLQFGPVTGTDYVAVGNGGQNVYKNLSVYYDTEDGQSVDNATALTRIKEEYMAQVKYNTIALNSPKMLEYVDRLKKFFNPGYRADTNYKAIQEDEVARIMTNNPYLEGANKVILAELIWQQTEKPGKNKK